MLRLVYKTLIVFIALIATFHSLSAQLTSEQVDALMEDALTKFNVAGAAISIVQDGKIIHEKGYGVREIGGKQKVDEHTNFQIASNSKAFTCTALAILVEEGKLDWKDKVQQHIPEFKMYNEYVTQNFTIEDLLTHRSGLGLGAGDLMLFPDGSDFTIQDILTAFQYFEPQSGFRTQFDYDNQLYMIAGEVIKRVSGMTWEAFIQKRIMEPLDMDHSAGSLANLKSKNTKSSSHSSNSGTIEKIGTYEDMINGAAGGIWSNVDDLANWMIANMNHGKYGPDLKKELISEASHHTLWSIHTVEEPSPNPRYNSHFRGYGLGFDLADKKGFLSVSHTGGLPGMLSIVTMLPDLNVGVCILTNTDAGGAGLFSSVSQTILDSYMGLDDFGWVDKYAVYFKEMTATGDSVVDAVWKVVESADQSKIRKSDFVGVYEDNWFGKVKIEVKGDQLWFSSLRSPKLNGPMKFYQANTFAIQWEYRELNGDAFAMFTLDENGKAIGIKMKGISPNIDFSYDFQDLDLHRVEE